MDRIINVVSQKSKLIGIILLFAATGFVLIAQAGLLGGGFMPVIGGLFLLIVKCALTAAVPAFIVAKQEKYAKLALIPVFCFWILDSIYTFLGNSYLIIDGMEGLIIAYALFQFFIACALLVAVSFFVVYVINKNKKWIQLAFCVLAGSLLFFLIEWAIALAVNADYSLEWADYFNTFYTYLLFPAGIVFITMHYLTEYLDVPAFEYAPAGQAQENVYFGEAAADEDEFSKDESNDADEALFVEKEEE